MQPGWSVEEIGGIGCGEGDHSATGRSFWWESSLNVLLTSNIADARTAARGSVGEVKTLHPLRFGPVMCVYWGGIASFASRFVIQLGGWLTAGIAASRGYEGLENI